MAQVQLSDGNFAVVPDEAVGHPEIVGPIVDQAEKQLADKYGAQAAQQNAPVTAGSKVYSATNVYPDTTMGHTMAWLDHNAGGNWMNRNIAQPIENATTPYFGQGGIGGTALRIGVNRGVGLVDLPATGMNVMKHAIEPKRGTEGDLPTISGGIDTQFGVPQLGPDASLTRQLIEGGLTGATPGGALTSLYQTAKNAVTGVAATASSDLGGHYFGEPGAYIANLLFGVPYKNLAAKAVAHGMADTETPPSPQGAGGGAPGAEGTWNATMAIRPTRPGQNFSGLTSQPPHSTDYSEYLPSFMSLANPQGQRIAASLSGLNYMGQPIEKAMADTQSFIRDAKNAAAWEAAGPGGVPPDVSAATVGPLLTQGAQDAILAINRDQSARQQAVENAMTERNQQLTSGQASQIFGTPGSREPGSAEVPTANIINTALDAVNRGQRGDPETAATQSRAQEMIDASANAPGYNRTPVPLPAQPTMTWSALTDMVGRLSDSLQKSGRQPVPPNIAAAIKSAANAEKEDAANAVSPGLGAQFRQNNEVYAQAQAALEQLRQIGGKELGASGEFTDVPAEQDVFGALRSRLQSPGSFADTYLHPAFPAQTRANIAGQLVSRLGENESKGPVAGFRPEAFGKWGYGGAADQRPGLSELLNAQTGAPTQPVRVLDEASRAAQNVSTQPSRFGLIKGLGSAALVQRGLEKVAQLARLLSPTGATPITALVGRTLSNTLESEPVKRAMANQPLDWANTIHRLNVVGAINNAEAANRDYDRVHGGLFSYRPPGSTP